MKGGQTLFLLYFVTGCPSWLECQANIVEKARVKQLSHLRQSLGLCGLMGLRARCVLFVFQMSRVQIPVWLRLRLGSLCLNGRLTFFLYQNSILCQ